MKLTTAQRGAAWMILGVLCMASMDVMAKTLGHRVPVAQIVWLRFVSPVSYTHLTLPTTAIV